jgi:hypothetical protein
MSANVRRLGKAGPPGGLDGGQHHADVVVGGVLDRGEALDETASERGPRGRGRRRAPLGALATLEAIRTLPPGLDGDVIDESPRCSTSVGTGTWTWWSRTAAARRFLQRWLDGCRRGSSSRDSPSPPTAQEAWSPVGCSG